MQEREPENFLELKPDVIPLAQATRLGDGKYEPDQGKAGIAVAKDGRRYVMTNRQTRRIDGKKLETLQLERERPKVKGKAARKAEKRARRERREAVTRMIRGQAALEGVDDGIADQD